MTQLGPAPNPSQLGVANRRFSSMRVAAASASQSYATTRILGMWVPAECFRKGTVIDIMAKSSSLTAALKLSIGGPGTAVGLGTLLTTTAPATQSVLSSRVVQTSDGLLSTFFWNYVWISDSASVDSTFANDTISIPIQPLNFVELYTSGTYTIPLAEMVLTPGGSSQFRGYQEVLTIG